MKNTEMKLVPKRNPHLILLIIPLFACGMFIWVNPVVFHMAYSIFDDPVCLSRVSKQLDIAPTRSAIIKYFEMNLQAGTSREKVHQTFGNIAPIVVHPYKNSQGVDYEEIVVRMCSKPLNNLVFNATYTDAGMLIVIEHESLP